MQFKDEDGNLINDEQYVHPPILGTSNMCTQNALECGLDKYDTTSQDLWEDTASYRDENEFGPFEDATPPEGLPSSLPTI